MPQMIGTKLNTDKSIEYVGGWSIKDAWFTRPASIVALSVLAINITNMGSPTKAGDYVSSGATSLRYGVAVVKERLQQHELQEKEEMGKGMHKDCVSTGHILSNCTQTRIGNSRRNLRQAFQSCVDIESQVEVHGTLVAAEAVKIVADTEGSVVVAAADNVEVVQTGGKGDLDLADSRSEAAAAAGRAEGAAGEEESAQGGAKVDEGAPRLMNVMKVFGRWSFWNAEGGDAAGIIDRFVF